MRVVALHDLLFGIIAFGMMSNVHTLSNIFYVYVLHDYKSEQAVLTSVGKRLAENSQRTVLF